MIQLLVAILLLFPLIAAQTFQQEDIYVSTVKNLADCLTYWNNARAEVGLQKMKKSAVKEIENFYRFYHGSSFFVINGQPVVYVHVWEAAHMLIKENLALNMASCPAGSSREVPSIIAAANEPYLLFTDQLLAKHGFNPNLGVPSFLVVREPIARFISGLNEYFYNGLGRRTPVTHKDLKAEIRKMLNLNRFHSWQEELFISSAYPMVGGVWRGLNISYVAKMETFDKDWRAIQSMYGLKLQPFNHFLGTRETDRDPLNIFAAYDVLASVEPYYIRAICNMLYIDFKVFKYEFPAECADLEKVSPDAQRKPRLSGTIPNGTLVRYARDRRVYLVKDNFRMPIFDFKVFRQYNFDLDDIITLHDKKLFDSIPLGDALMR